MTAVPIRRKMRIGCLQFAPQVGDVDNNLNRADAVLSRANPEDLDVLVLPEMAFSGMSLRLCIYPTISLPILLALFFFYDCIVFRHYLVPCARKCREE